MLKGRTIDLCVVERTQLPILHQWFNDVDFVGEFEPFDQDSLAGLEKWFDGMSGSQTYFIQKKDGTPVGTISYFKSKDCTGIGYMLVPEERCKGYGSEAVQMMVDYLFLHKDIVRIQAETHPDNLGSQRVLEKAGFTKEGIIRRSFLQPRRLSRYRDVEHPAGGVERAEDPTDRLSQALGRKPRHRRDSSKREGSAKRFGLSPARTGESISRSYRCSFNSFPTENALPSLSPIL